MSTENLPVLRVPSREEVRSRSLTRLMDFNEIPRIIIEDPKFTSGVSFKNFKNNFKDSYVDINARNAFNKTKSSSPVKARSMKQIEEENPEKESKNNLSIYKVANNSPKTPRKLLESEQIYEFLKERKRFMKTQFSGERSASLNPEDNIMAKLKTQNTRRQTKRGSLSNLYSFNNEINGGPIEKKKFIHPTVKKIFRRVVESTEHGSKTNFEALKEAFAIHDPAELRAINRIPMQAEALPDYNEIIKKLENKIVTTFMDKMSLYRKTFTDNIVEMEENKKYATKKDLGLVKREDKRLSQSVDRQRLSKKLIPILERKKSDIMEANEKLYNRSMEKYDETGQLLENAHQGVFTEQELDFMNAVKKGSANQIATKLAKSEELIKLRDHLGQTCLHWAVRRRKEDILVELLGKRGLEFEARDVTGRRALDLARNMKYYDMMAIMEDFLKEQIFIKY